MNVEKEAEIGNALSSLLKLSTMVQAREKLTKYVLDSSSLRFEMPKIKLIVPRNLEQEDCLSLKLSTDMAFKKESKEQHCVKYQVKYEDG